MPEDWSKLEDIDPLADGCVSIDLAIALREFPRLRPPLVSAVGPIEGRIRFDRDRGVPIADVEVRARVVLICQRCLAPLECPIESRAKVALVSDAAEGSRMPGELETILAQDRRISMRDLLEEELLLALPAVPLHAPLECSAPGGVPVAPEEALPDGEPDTQRHRPFERLDELLGRRS
ncbi:MAG: YceD family protein [Steroidobacteraceae bacterium]